MKAKQAQAQTPAPIHFKTRLFTIGSWTILRLPEAASAKLPSRGMVMIEGTINGHPLRAPLEPDGRWRHWLKVDETMQQRINARAGDTVIVTLMPTKKWVEPKVPADLQRALAATPAARILWQRITPMARWEWIRWTRSTDKSETRKRRIEAACSKMTSGERRPCCWNRNLCTEPSVSRNGMLLDPAAEHENANGAS